MPRINNPTNVLTGLLFLGLAALFGYQSLQLDPGTAAHMGPGYFPLALSALLGLIGLVVLVLGWRTPGEMPRGLSVRGLVMPILAVVVFAMTIRHAGFLASVAGTVFLAYLGSDSFTLRRAVPLVAGFTLFAWLVFIKGLGLPIPPLGPWLGGH